MKFGMEPSPEDTEAFQKVEMFEHPNQAKLGGGFNPAEKYLSKCIISPARDKKKPLKPPPRT